MARTIRVFLVEDMHHMQQAMADLLRSLGDFTLVGSAATEAEAILWLREHAGEWDLAVVDLVLTQGSGIGVVARSRQRPPGTALAVLSEYVTPVIRDHCAALGADAAFARSEMDAFIAFCETLRPPADPEREP